MKPENVLIGDDGRVKVADFGLVRAVDTNTTASTGSVLGTVSYLAPEQIEHGTADARVDVYACGVVLYEMLTGGKPHAGGTPAQVLYQHLHEDVPPPSALVPGLAAAAGRAGRAGHRPRPDGSARTTPWRCSSRARRPGRADRRTAGRRAAAGQAAPADGATAREDRTSVIPRR